MIIGCAGEALRFRVSFSLPLAELEHLVVVLNAVFALRDERG